MILFWKAKRANSSWFILLLLALSSLSFFTIHMIRPAHAQPTGGAPFLGIDCGLGSTQAVLNATGFPVGDGTIDNSCTWIGDVDRTGSMLGTSDGTLEPLVSDNPESLPAGTGGGFTAEVRLNGINSSFSIIAFDISISYDARYLKAVAFDQNGLPFGGPACPASPVCIFTVPSARVLDNTHGVAHLAQTMIGGNVSTDVTLFRVRFDVIGIGSSPLTISGNPVTVSCQTGTACYLPHTLEPGLFDSESFFDPSHTLGWNVTWFFSPNPEIPGQNLNLSAIATCPGCTLPLSYTWTNSSSTGILAKVNPAMVTSPTLFIHRVALNVTDAAHHSVVVVRLLPLEVSATGPSSFAVGMPAGFTGLWMGGVPSYSGNWRYCPGSIFNIHVCSKPTASFSPTTAQTNGQSVVYNFAGIYNDTLAVKDSTPAQAGPVASAISSFLANVTGGPPVFTVNLSSNFTGSVAAGHAVNFTASLAYSPLYNTCCSIFESNRFSYTFIFGDGTSATVSSGSSASVLKSYTKTGVFSVKVLVQESGSIAISKIEEFGTLAITVILPFTLVLDPATAAAIQGTNVSVSVTVALTDGSTQNVTLTASGLPSKSTVSFKPASGFPAFSSTMALNTSSTTPVGSYTIVVNASTALGIQAAAVFHLIIVMPMKVNLTLTSLPLLVGGYASFTAAVSGGTPPYTYKWDFGDNTSGFGSPISHSYSSARTFKIVLTVMDSNGFTFTTSKSIIVSQLPANSSSPLTSAIIYGATAAATLLAVSLVYVKRRKFKNTSIQSTAHQH
jgi:hypothetical protein